MTRYFPWTRASDGVALLRHDPLGMFLYNQRSIVVTAALAFLVVISLVAFTQRAGPKDLRALLLLWIAWLLAVVLSLLLHRRLRFQLAAWGGTAVPTALPSVLDVYFVMDAVILVAIVAVGQLLSLPLGDFAFMVVATAVVYTTYAFGRRRIDRRNVAIVAFLAALSIALVFPYSQPALSNSWLQTVLHAAPILTALAIIILSASVVAWLRQKEQRDVVERMLVLGEYASQLAVLTPDKSATKTSIEAPIRRELLRVLKDLCNGRREGFWYRAACLWTLTDHLDHGRVFFPTATVNFPEGTEYKRGVDAQSGFLDVEDIEVVHSVREHRVLASERWRFRMTEDIPAALVPLRGADHTVGVLMLYGNDSAPASLQHEAAFLAPLASTLATALDRWDEQIFASAITELDALPNDSLSELFASAAIILRRYLSADSATIAFRDDPTSHSMRVVAAAGFRKSPLDLTYTVGRGLTGRCAETGNSIRVDDVRQHRDQFDKELLAALQKLYGREIVSWMAIPLGAPPRNFGVLKVLNRTGPHKWFTKRDERVGAAIAIRLQVAIERSLHMQHMQRATTAATRMATQAEDSRRRSEAVAQQRQQDLMTVSHEIQGPLIAVMGALSAIDKKQLDHKATEYVDHGIALLEDALTLSYGILTSLAGEAGRDTAFQQTDVDVATEINYLVDRLRRTHQRNDLQVEARQRSTSRVVRVDRRVFVSVTYNLIHNAMKYAAPNSTLVLEYGELHGGSTLKVKTIGEPIRVDEREVIFEKFRRGQSVERGRHHGGVGLGLWVARELMRRIGGDLELELSPSYPRLSVFVVRWPHKANPR